MAWKLKEEFKEKSTLSMRRTLDSLKQYHIKNLSEKTRNKFFKQTVAKPKKEKDAGTEGQI